MWESIRVTCWPGFSLEFHDKEVHLHSVKIASHPIREMVVYLNGGISMQKVMVYEQISEIEASISKRAFSLLKNRPLESFIGIDQFNLLVFNWYGIHSHLVRSPQIAVCFDQNNIFFLCENPDALKMVNKIIEEQTKEQQLSNEELLYHFFMHLLKNDVNYLNDYEILITEVEDRMVAGLQKDCLTKIFAYRKDLLRLKRYYEQLGFIFEELAANENGLLSENGVRLCTILSNRTDRLFSNAVNLRDYIAQVLEAYQSQLDYLQNNLMKIFTVITTIFLPLTLLVGWYGMNFDMPEFHSAYGYPVIIAVSAFIVIMLIILFKRKKWM